MTTDALCWPSLVSLPFAQEAQETQFWTLL